MEQDDLFICKLPDTLNKNETYELLSFAQKGSKEARDKIINHNIKLVLYVIFNKFKNTEYDKRDLVSVGIVGLMIAVDTFDKAKGYEFSTYATNCIKNEILLYIRRNKKHQNIDSLDRPVTNDSEDLLKDIIPSNIDIVSNYEDTELINIIRKLISNLSSREKEIIFLYFGFYDDRIYTQDEIANIFNLSRARVSIIINKALIKMKKELIKANIIDPNYSLTKRMRYYVK